MKAFPINFCFYEILNLSQNIESLMETIQEMEGEKSDGVSAMASKLQKCVSETESWKRKFLDAQKVYEENQEQMDIFATERLQMAATIEAFSIELAENQNSDVIGFV